MLTFKFKLLKNDKKNKCLHQQIDIGGIVYNHCLALQRRHYKYFKKYVSPYRLQKHITKLKKCEKYIFWNILGSQAIQDITQRIDFGYKKFFRKENKRPPKFRCVKNAKSFTLKQTGYKLLEDNCIKIGQTIYKYFKSREIVGNIKTVTIKRDKLGDLYIFVVTDDDDHHHQSEVSEIHSTSCKSVGFDFGLKTFLVGSDHAVYESPQFFKRGLKSIRKASKCHNGKKKGGSNRERARLALCRCHKHVANQRLDHHFKLARELCQCYSHVFLETLNMDGMKRLWGRKVSDLGFAQFVAILHHQAQKFGTVVHHIDRWFPSSKMCSCCGYVYKELSLHEREWDCPQCGAHHVRDFNAATNIHVEGMSSIGLSGFIRPPTQAAVLAALSG